VAHTSFVGHAGQAAGARQHAEQRHLGLSTSLQSTLRPP
jgi:hypothetical protein